MPMHAIEYAVTDKHSVNRGARGKRIENTALLQGQANRLESVLAQDALFAQHTARAQDAPFQPRRRAVRGSARLTVCEPHPIKASTSSERNPVGHRAEAYPEFRCYRAQASPPAHRLNQLAAPMFDRTFLAIALTYRNPRTLQHARARYETRGLIRRPAAPSACWRAGEIPVALRAPSISPAPCLSSIQCSTNAETQVFY